MVIKNKKGFEFGFNWMFAIIVGAVIIFLAIYFAVQFVKTNKDITNTETAFEIKNLLNRVSTNIESTSTSKITSSINMRMYNDCNIAGNFGYQAISTSLESGIGKKWENPKEEARTFDKYIFSSKIEEGKVFEMFVKPFNMPFKIADLIFLWSENDNYCFVNPPEEIEKDIGILNSDSINISFSVIDCKKESKKVCFSLENGCDIIVEPNRVRKDRKSLYYQGSLVYGAIFAEPEIYECQVRRLMKRASELSSLYLEKTTYLGARECNSNLESELAIYSNRTSILNSSFNLIELSDISKQMSDKNDLLLCNLWREND